MRAFVLMPFDEEFETVFQDLVKKPLEEAGYEVERADTSLDQQNIMRDVVEGIAKADLVIADLTASNPNVFYELGLSHGLGIPTVLLTQTMDHVPFDLRSYRCIEYSTHFQDAKDLPKKLIEIAEACSLGTINFGSPVIDFHPQKNRHDRLHSSRSGVKVTDEEQESESEKKEEKGLLDFITEGEEAERRIGVIVENIMNGMREVGSKMETHNLELEAIGQSSKPGSAAHAHKIMLETAKDMSEYASLIRSHLPDLDGQVELFVDNTNGYVHWLANNPEKARKGLSDFHEPIAGLLEGVTTALAGIHGYRESVSGLRKVRISRSVNRAALQLLQATDSLIATFERIQAHCSRLLALIDTSSQD